MSMPYRFIAGLAAVALAAGASTAFADGHDGGGHHGRHGDRDRGERGARVIESALFGSQPTGPTLFGVKPGGAPWVISRGEAEVRRDGRVRVRIRGLVIPTPPQSGTNPLSDIAATVFCGGTAVGTTHAVPFSTAGDARIDEKLATPLPMPCLVPAVLLNPAPGGAIAAGTYIAATGS
jgi:hypothetical protein